MLTVKQCIEGAWNDSHAFMVLNDDVEHADETGGGKWSLRQCIFLTGSRKTVPLACRLKDCI